MRLENPQQISKVLNASLCIQLLVYVVEVFTLYKVRNLDPLISTAWASTIATLTFAFIGLGALNFLLLAVGLAESSQKKSFLSIRKIILISLIVLAFLIAKFVISWISHNSVLFDGGWKFIP